MHHFHASPLLAAAAEVAPQKPPGSGILSDVGKSLGQMRDDAIAFLPKFLTSAILFIIGVAIAWFIARSIRLVMQKGGIDAICERIGISRILGQAGIKAPLSDIVGRILFWVLILMFLMSAAESLELEPISLPLRGLVAFLPKVVTALIITMAGLVIADLARGFIGGSAQRLGLDYAKAVANLLYAFIMLVVLTIAIGTLGVDTTLVRHAVEIMLLAVALAAALALGLGMRPLAQGIVSGVYARDLYPVGSKLTLKEHGSGEVISVGPVATRVQLPAGEMLVIPNSDLVSEVVKSEPAPAGERE